MTNFEWLKSFTHLQDLGHELCRITPDCELCPVNDLCHEEYRHNGFIVWLAEEHHEKK